MLKTILACFENELTFLQTKEVELGFKHGLKKEDVKIYASREYNHLQMRELRLCLEYGIEKKKMKRILHSDVSYLKMKEMRLKLEKGEKIAIDLRRYVPLCMIGVCLCLFVTMFPVNEASLELKTDSITLQCGEIFEPMSYIKSFSSKKGQLILPSSIDTSKQGNHVVIYRLKTTSKDIEKVLYVKVE